MKENASIFIVMRSLIMKLKIWSHRLNSYTFTFTATNFPNPFTLTRIACVVDTVTKTGVS